MKKFLSAFFSKLKERKVYTRIITIVCLLVAFFGLWGPFVHLQFSTGIQGPFGNTLVAYDHVDVGNVSLRNFADFSNVKDIEIFDERVDSYNFAGINIYETIKNPPKTSGYLNTLIDNLDTETLEALSDPSFKTQMQETFPKYGEDIFVIASSLGQALLDGREVLIAANNVIMEGKEVLNEASQILNTVEEYKTTANIVVFIFFVLAVVPMILLCIPRVSPKIPRIFCYVCTGVVLLLIIGVGVGNSLFNNYAQQLVAEANTTISTQLSQFIKEVLGNKAGVLALFGGTSSDYLSFTSEISVAWAAILSVAAFAASVIASYFIPKKIKKEKVK